MMNAKAGAAEGVSKTKGNEGEGTEMIGKGMGKTKGTKYDDGRLPEMAETMEAMRKR